MKINLDKYYTPVELAERLIAKTFEVVGKENITDIIEPSAGNGSFSNLLHCRAIDIEPEADGIERGDFLAMDIPYRKGRLIIGNPPYGERLQCALDFYNKSVEIADYIAFVLPISQLNNSSSFYKFDLVYSDDLGKSSYSGRKLWCCFNIYRRPLCGANELVRRSIDGITFYRQDRKDYDDITDYDIRICYWGNGSVGKILTDKDERYSGEYKIKIVHPKKAEILNVLKTFDWKSYTKSISMSRLKQYHIIDVLEHEIDGLCNESKKLF